MPADMHALIPRYALVPLLIFALAGCSGEEQPVQATQHSVQARVSVLQMSSTVATSATPGSVVALESVQVASRLMGYIRNIAVVEGQTVKKGQRLFSIDPLDIEGAVEQARLGLKQAEAALEDARLDYERFEHLYRDEVVTRQQYEKMKLNHDIAESRMAQARSGLGTAQGQMRYATVTSPIDAVVIRKLANEGDIAAPGHPVLLLENPSRLQVQTSVAQDLYRNLHLGQRVMVEIDGQPGPVAASVARLSPAADPVAHTYLVKLDVAATNLSSGAFARVLFPVGRRELLALAQAAVLNRAGIPGVFVVDGQGIARYRMVRLGREADGQVEVLSGLNPGEHVITGNAAQVNNGDKVSALRKP